MNLKRFRSDLYVRGNVPAMKNSSSIGIMTVAIYTIFIID